MNSKAHSLTQAALALAALSMSAAALAQQSPWRSFVSVSPVREEADLDLGGNVDVTGVILRAGTSLDLGGGNRAGITLNYDYSDNSFNNPVAFGGVAPWQTLQRYGFSTPLTYALEDGWSLGATPSVDWFKENGAKTGDSLVWGASFSAVKRYADGNFLGLGFSAFSRLEENNFTPFPIINWRLSERWLLKNPLPAGPTGPAGLELDYLFDSGWSAGVGAAYRVVRYRLSESGPTPNGIGQISGVPVFVRATRDLGETLTLNLYAGAVANGKLRVEDPTGNRIQEEDFDLSPFLGANFLMRF